MPSAVPQPAEQLEQAAKQANKADQASRTGQTDPSRATVRPLRRDAELNRRKILEAAGEVFATHGLDATLDDVARHAGVGVGTVYRRFPDKEALVEALFEERLATLVALAEDCLNAPDPWDGLARLLEEACSMQATDRGLRDVVLGTAYGRDRVARLRGALAPLARGLVERATAAGRVRADLNHTDIPTLMLAIISVADYTKGVSPDVWRRTLGIVLDGLRPARDTTAPLTVDPLGEDQLDDVMRAYGPSPR